MPNFGKRHVYLLQHPERGEHSCYFFVLVDSRFSQFLLYGLIAELNYRCHFKKTIFVIAVLEYIFPAKMLTQVV